MLATVLTDPTNTLNLQTRQFAGVVLKNMLKNHLITLKAFAEQEVTQVKETLFKFLVS